jgi:hypothetical protein
MAAAEHFNFVVIRPVDQRAAIFLGRFGNSGGRRHPISRSGDESRKETPWIPTAILSPLKSPKHRVTCSRYAGSSDQARNGRQRRRNEVLSN